MKKIVLFGLIIWVLVGSVLLYKAVQKQSAPSNATHEISADEIEQMPDSSPIKQLFQFQKAHAGKQPTHTEGTTNEPVSQPTPATHTDEPTVQPQLPLKVLYQLQEARAGRQSATTQDDTKRPNQPVDQEMVKQKFIEGLDAFNQDDYQTAIRIWTEVKELDPTNSDADLALRKAKEITGQIPPQNK